MLPKQGFATWCVILNAESYEWFLVDYISAVGYGLFDSIFILAGIRVKVVDCISIVSIHCVTVDFIYRHQKQPTLTRGAFVTATEN